MKIPPNILHAPLTYLDENMIKAFKLSGFGCFPLWTNHGCALFVHIDKKSIKDCKNAVHSVRLELHEIDDCPLIRLAVKVYDRPGDPLHMDCFLNITRTDHDHIPMFEALTRQEWLIFHWYDEKLQYVRSSGIHWEPEQWEAVKEIAEKAAEVITRTGGGDFDKAKVKFMATHPV